MFAKGNEDMYANISKMAIYSSLHLGWSGKETQKYLYLAISTAVWCLLAGVLGGLVQLLIGGFTALDVTALALFGCDSTGFVWCVASGILWRHSVSLPYSSG